MTSRPQQDNAVTNSQLKRVCGVVAPHLFTLPIPPPSTLTRSECHHQARDLVSRLANKISQSLKKIQSLMRVSIKRCKQSVSRFIACLAHDHPCVSTMFARVDRWCESTVVGAYMHCLVAVHARLWRHYTQRLSGIASVQYRQWCSPPRSRLVCFLLSLCSFSLPCRVLNLMICVS